MRNLCTALSLLLGFAMGYGLKTYPVLVATLVAVVVYVISHERARYKFTRLHTYLLIGTLMMWVTHYLHVLK